MSKEEAKTMLQNGVEHQQPLDKLVLKTIEDGKSCQRLALHVHWVQKRAWMHFIPFTRLQKSQSITGAKDNWLAATSELVKDIQWLLSRPHHCFWSQLVFDPGARGALASYLERAPRCYDKELASLDEDQHKVLARLHALVFKVYLRLTTLKESNSCYLTEECHGRLLYDHFLLDVPTMLDLCLLYGHSATSQLSAMLAHALHVQPHYSEDLSSAALMVTKALKEVGAYFVTQPTEEGGEEGSFAPILLSQQAPGPKGELSPHQLQDLTLFLLDIVSAVATLLQLLPSVCSVMHSSMVEMEIAHFYENVVPEMWNHVLSLPDDSMCQDLQIKLNTTRFHLLNIAKCTLGTRVQKIIESLDTNAIVLQAEEYLTVLSECLAEAHFTRDFHVLCPIDEELFSLRQKCPDQLDPAKFEFLLESVFNCFEKPKRSRQRQLAESRSKQAAIKVSQNENVIPSANDVGGCAMNDAEALVLESLVSEIQDMLPDLGAGFLQKCLHHFKFKKEDVVNAILEESLPKELQGLDRTMPLPCGSIDEAKPGPSVPVRLNVFDHDEFDVMSRDHIDKSRVHKGKRPSKHRNLKQLLDDKEDLQGLRDVYSRYSSVQENLYDDEYDDTYDEVNVSVDEPEPERRPFVVPRVLEPRRAAANDYEEEEEEDEPGGSQARSNDFVQDPAQLRAQAEQRRADKMGQQYRPQHQPAKDFVGKPKGQGQDASVVINRQKKNTNKSSHGNHNRRAGAERKMRQGMIPS